jgi:TolB protein
MNADGSDPRSFTGADSRETGPAAWSPEGDRLAFMTWLPTDDETTNLAYLVIADVESGDMTQLTPGLHPNFVANTIDWSPDGTMIVMEGPGEADIIQDIYRAAVDGSVFENLTKEPTGDVLPAFSPDGSQVVFASERDGNLEIYVMNADGSDPRNLSNLPDRFDWEPVWSPDGTQIAFVSISLADQSDAEIYVMNADGSDVHAVTSGGGAEGFPVWSPDGGQLAYQITGDDKVLDIGVIGVDGGDPQNLTQDEAIDYFPQWKPASQE